MDQEGTFQDVADKFSVALCTAREWVLKYLGDDVYEGMVTRVSYSGDVEERARDMRRDGASIEEIANTLNVSAATISRWCRFIIRGEKESGYGW